MSPDRRAAHGGHRPDRARDAGGGSAAAAVPGAACADRSGPTGSTSAGHREVRRRARDSGLGGASRPAAVLDLGGGPGDPGVLGGGPAGRGDQAPDVHGHDWAPASQETVAGGGCGDRGDLDGGRPRGGALPTASPACRRLYQVPVDAGRSAWPSAPASPSCSPWCSRVVGSRLGVAHGSGRGGRRHRRRSAAAATTDGATRRSRRPAAVPASRWRTATERVESAEEQTRRPPWCN